MPELIPLSRWHQRPTDHHVAVNLGTPIEQQQLESRVRCWMAALRQQSGKRWGVFHSDSFEYLSILLALWQLKRTACIPSDNRPGTITRLQNELDGLVGEFDNAQALTTTQKGKLDDAGWILPQAQSIALEIYTSGSTGAPKSIHKTMDQLESESAAIESLWPSQAGTVILATVSHQHIFGMTFGLFWPFSSGRAFETRFCEFNEDVRFKAGLYQRFALVSSPSHLGRFSDSIDWAGIANRCEYVVSSAAPLAREDSLQVGRLLLAPVREIYGSSETGAIASRIQLPNQIDASWHALPGVSLESTDSGTLKLGSPYLGDLDYYELPDRVAFDNDGGFSLLGRVDSIVKVEGKRVSLTAIEQLLQQSDCVKLVKALTIERSRVETAIVMQLSPVGQSLLQSRGRRALISEFRQILLQSFEAVVIPRRWRFVDEMPFNRQGKLPLDNLRALFAKNELIWPQILEREIEQNQASMQCLIPPQLLYFDGHMPGRPILPGVVQVHWAENYGRDFFAIKGHFERLEVIKFQQVILPDYQVTLTLTYTEENRKLGFRYESDRGVHSSGRICFAP
ncbi:MAG: AMP-binding protein [Gammaproteobacteria bacterium]|nr:AMP-binding protein [Gammaproteobacteria bacterium]